MKFIAHRGLRSNIYKENSIAAFLNAIQNPNISGFEFDIRSTLDKEFIVNHNAFIEGDLIRLSKVKTLKEKYKLSSLEEVLKLVTDKMFLIEVKDIDIDYPKFIKLIHKYSYKNIYIMSFHNSVIKKLKEYHVKAKLGILNYVLNSEETYDYDFICLLNNLATRKIIESYKRQNVEVIMYGILNEKKDIKYQDVYYIVDRLPKIE